MKALDSARTYWLSIQVKGSAMMTKVLHVLVDVPVIWKSFSDLHHQKIQELNATGKCR